MIETTAADQEREDLYRASCQRHAEKVEAERRWQWAAYHEAQAANLRRTLESLIAEHRTKAERLRRAEATMEG